MPPHIPEPPPTPQRPRTRADCRNGPRPCAWVSCRHHLYADIQRNGRLVINSPVEPDKMAETCALDVAERGGMTLKEIGRMLGLTKERVRQIADHAMNRLAEQVEKDGTPIPQPEPPPTEEDEFMAAVHALDLGPQAPWLARMCQIADSQESA